MADIFHDFWIQASAGRVFDAVSKPSGLDAWWTSKSSGEPRAGEKYKLVFGPEYQWEATVSKYVPENTVEFEMTRSDKDWNNTHVGFIIKPGENGTNVQFYHTGWPAQNEHYRIFSYCWAMYLRLLKLNLENGLIAPYEERLNV
ncbi:MAG: SRPBCC domain-containing protein [Cyclobacteriaceae bacterium]